MKEFINAHYTKIKIGDIFNIHQTVNGCSKFILVSLDPIDIRYIFDFSYKYEYDLKELLDIEELEVMGNIDVYLNFLKL